RRVWARSAADGSRLGQAVAVHAPGPATQAKPNAGACRYCGRMCHPKGLKSHEKSCCPAPNAKTQELVEAQMAREIHRGQFATTNNPPPPVSQPAHTATLSATLADLETTLRERLQQTMRDCLALIDAADAMREAANREAKVRRQVGA
ncbi:MAG TPA: hypothetical protein P5137_04760, partial [Candidatus Brocadiia bacterium]|nr:hypothetical protein [Candidatus Brocadiia bacterium]